MKKWFKIILTVAFLFFITWIFWNPIQAYFTVEVVTVDVIQKDRVCDSYNTANETQECRYLIFTDGETFQNTDTFWYLKWNSSDVYGSIQDGKTCEMKVYGFRIGLFSMYRNIVWADCNLLLKGPDPNNEIELDLENGTAKRK